VTDRHHDVIVLTVIVLLSILLGIIVGLSIKFHLI
jgi:hypothetical protein